MHDSLARGEVYLKSAGCRVQITGFVRPSSDKHVVCLTKSIKLAVTEITTPYDILPGLAEIFWSFQKIQSTIGNN